MAKIDSKDIGLYVNQGDETSVVAGTPDWVLIACSTSDGFSGTTDNVEIATKCNDGFKENLPSGKSWSFSNSGYAEATADLDAGQVSYASAEALWYSGEVKEFKLANADDSYYRMGKAYISSYNETADEGDYLQFDLEVMGTGKYVTTPPIPA